MLSPHDPALVIGCGYLGRRAATLWRDAGQRVVALTRGRAAELAALGLEPVVGDVLDPASLRGLPRVGTVLYAVGMDRSAGRSMRDVYVGGLANVLDALDQQCAGNATASLTPPALFGKGVGGFGRALNPSPLRGGEENQRPRFLYVSSTGVYGQTDSSVVDETSPTEPIEESGKVVLEAERLLRSRRPDAIILRFAGIYGPGRLLRRQSLLAGEPLAGDADKWLNLIHVEDGARAVLAAEAHGRPGETYLVADDTPIRRRDFYTHLAHLIGAPPARFEPHPPGRTPPPEPNRRVSTAKLRDELGFVPQFPSYVEGLAGSV